MSDPDAAVATLGPVGAAPGRSVRRWPRWVAVAGGIVFVLWVSAIALLIGLALAIGEEETGPGDWAAPVWFDILALLAVVSFGALLIDRSGRLAAGAFAGTVLVAWVGPDLIGGSAAPWAAGNPPLAVVVPGLFFAVAAIWAGRSIGPTGTPVRRWTFWLGLVLVVPALGMAGYLAVGLIEPGEYRLTVRTFACPAGSGPALFDAEECVSADGAAVGWQIESDRLDRPLESTDAEIESATASWDGLPDGLYLLTLTAATLPPGYATIEIPAAGFGDQMNAFTLFLGNDGRYEPEGSVFRAFRSLTVDAYLFPGLLDSGRRGTIAITPYRCPVGMTAATLDPAACTADLLTIEDAFLMAWPTDERQLDLADAARESNAYVWREVPSGPYALIVVRLAEGGARFVVAGGSSADARGEPAPEGGTVYEPFLLPASDDAGPERSVALYVLFEVPET